MLACACLSSASITIIYSINNKKMSKYFRDDFEHLKVSDNVASQRNLSETVQIPFRDSKTGAEYLVQERRPNGPQGDFRVQREDRSLALSFGSRPDELETRVPEAMVSEADIELRVRERERSDVRKSMSLRPTNEPMESEIQDHGEFTVDLQGRIKDKPKNVRGLFGTEDSRPTALPIKPETVQTRPSEKAMLSNPQSITTGHAYSRQQDAIEKKIGSNEKLQELLNNAFRGLQSLQKVKGPQSDKSDRIFSAESVFQSKSILDAGLLKPWTAPKSAATSDRPHRPDDIAHAVGTRALQSLIKGPLAHDIQDLPKADRDDMSKALGRAILNALASGPEQKGQQSDLEDRVMTAEMKKSISLSISPSILAGLVTAEQLSDRRPIELSAGPRAHGPAQKEIAGVPNRHTVRVSERPENSVKAIERPVYTAITNKKKNLFYDDSEARERPELNFNQEKKQNKSELLMRSEKSQHGLFSQRIDR